MPLLLEAVIQEVRVQYQAEMLVQVLKLAEVKALELVRAVPQEQGQMESHSYLLLLEVQKVARQAVALQALAERALVQAPLMEVPLVSAQARARALAEAEAQVEVLEAQAVELVEVPLQGLE
jgi:hypothetical protein